MSDALTLVRTAWPGRHIRASVTLRDASPQRMLQVALGLLWLLDAALQYQPYMFTASFVGDVIRPAFAGDPVPVASSGLWAAGVMAHHIVLCNTIFATVQLLIGVAILVPRTARIGLATSLPWALGVWWFGEGLGGVLTGASPLTGTPGGVILYALLAVLLWPVAGRERDDSVATSGPAGRVLPRLIWLVLWGGVAGLFLLPANRSADGLHGLLAGEADGEPSWLAGTDHHLASLLTGRGLVVSVALAVCCAVVALSVLSPALVRASVVLAVLLALAMWLAEDFGGIFTGRGTDPNSGPLLVLLALSYAPRTDPTRRHSPARRALRQSDSTSATPVRLSERDEPSGPLRRTLEREVTGVAATWPLGRAGGGRHTGRAVAQPRPRGAGGRL